MTTNTVRRARLSNKVRRSWCVREKLMVVHYLERGHSIKSTSNIDGDVYEDDILYENIW